MKRVRTNNNKGLGGDYRARAGVREESSYQFIADEYDRQLVVEGVLAGLLKPQREPLEGLAVAHVEYHHSFNVTKIQEKRDR